MATCKWCGRTFAGVAQTGLIGGGYSTCSENCRIELARSVTSGNTPAYRNPVESGLKLLLKVFLVCGVGSYLVSMCGGNTGASTQDAQTRVESRATDNVTDKVTRDASPHPRESFGKPGQFDGSSNGNSETEEAASEGEIRTIPAPEPVEVDQVESDTKEAS
jgi:hypothetical protein